METKWSIEDVFNKVGWEGGIAEAMDWGLTSDQIDDPELAAAWKELEAIEPVLRRIEAIFARAGF